MVHGPCTCSTLVVHRLTLFVVDKEFFSQGNNISVHFYMYR
jgi:hypothetical protein